MCCKRQQMLRCGLECAFSEGGLSLEAELCMPLHVSLSAVSDCLAGITKSGRGCWHCSRRLSDSQPHTVLLTAVTPPPAETPYSVEAAVIQQQQ